MANLTVRSETPRGLSSAVVLFMNGALDADTAEIFQDQINEARSKGAARFILDLEHIHYINSTGFSCLTNFSDAIASQGGEVILVRAQQKVRLVLDMLSLGDRFKSFLTLEEALDYVKSLPSLPKSKDVTTVIFRKPEPRGASSAGHDTQKIEVLELADEDDSTVILQGNPPAPKVSPSTGTAREAGSGPKPASPGAVKNANEMECKGCRGILVVKDPGTYKCPRCFTVFTVIAAGKANFLSRRRVIPVQITVGLSESGIEGASVMAGLLAQEAGFDRQEFEQAARDIMVSIRREAYKENPNNVCHLLYVLTDDKLEMSFTHYGEKIILREDDKDKGVLFETARRVMDQFELKLLEGSGSMVVAAKLRPIG